MSEGTKLEVRQREIRSRLAELSQLEKLTDEHREESRKLVRESVDIDTKLNALAVENETETRDSQREELESRCDIGRVFDAVSEHRVTDGAERELQTEVGLHANQIPLSMLRMEHREVTPAPGNVGQDQQTIIPGVFPQGVAAFLGVHMPTVAVGESVFPVLSTNATVHSPAKGTAAAETTGSFDAEVLSPGRLQASFFYSREDRAKFAGMGAALRENLSMALSDALDKQIVSGPNGLLTGSNLGNNAASAETTYAAYISQLAAGRVDGRYAGSLADIRIVMGSGAYAHGYKSYQGSGGNMDSFSAAEKLERITSGIRVSAHVPPVNSNKQNTIVRLGMRRDMVAPMWEGVTLIPDEVTRADQGEVKISAILLYAVKILRAAGFHKQEIQVA